MVNHFKECSKLLNYKEIWKILVWVFCFAVVCVFLFILFVFFVGFFVSFLVIILFLLQSTSNIQALINLTIAIAEGFCRIFAEGFLLYFIKLLESNFFLKSLGTFGTKCLRMDQVRLFSTNFTWSILEYFVSFHENCTWVNLLWAWESHVRKIFWKATIYNPWYAYQLVKMVDFRKILLT